MENKHTIKVNLNGMIELLSNNLYSNPSVYIRELLQNAIDAISARMLENKDFAPMIEFSKYEIDDESYLEIIDNGIGLTEDEVHEFIGVIGNSSKTDINDFIGQFGIGLLSCFVVSEEIIMITKSEYSTKPIKWRGTNTGEYFIEKLDLDMHQGTKVILKCKPTHLEYMIPAYLNDKLSFYGGLLPYPIYLKTSDKMIYVNKGQEFWLHSDLASKEEILDYGNRIFRNNFIGYIPLKSELGEVQGIGYILPHTINLSAGSHNRVYLKNMLLTDNDQSLMPEWSVFLKCIFNVNDLEPTASRENFYKNSKLEQVREHLGNQVKEYLIQLAREDTNIINRVFSIHNMNLQSLMTHDDDVFKIFIDFLEFETTLGRIRFKEIREKHSLVYYVFDIDEFKQISEITYSKNMCILNLCYSYNREILQMCIRHFADMSFIEMTPTSFSELFIDPSPQELIHYDSLIKTSEEVLSKYNCSVSIKKFIPKELPALYLVNGHGSTARQMRKNLNSGSDTFGDLMNHIIDEHYSDTLFEICFNAESPLINRLISCTDKYKQRKMIELVYLQTLMIGHYSLSETEMKVFSDNLCYLIEENIMNTQNIM